MIDRFTRLMALMVLSSLAVTCSAAPPAPQSEGPEPESPAVWADPAATEAEVLLAHAHKEVVQTGQTVPTSKQVRAALARSRRAVGIVFPLAKRNITGSAVSIGDGYLLTNDHVVARAAQKKFVTVILDHREYRAEIVARDLYIDVSLIKINTKDKLPFVELGDSDAVQVGDWALAIGNAKATGSADSQPSSTLGVISGKHRINSPMGATEYYRYTDGLQLDVTIHPGNSGGGLMDLNGRLIGINGAGGALGTIGLAIPVNQIKRYLPTMKKGIDTHHADLLIEGRPLNVGETLALGRGGCRVLKLTSDPKKAKRTLKQRDILLAIFDKKQTYPIRSELELVYAIDKFNVGDTVTLDIIRNSKRMQIKEAIGSLVVDKAVKVQERKFGELHNAGLNLLRQKKFGPSIAKFKEAIAADTNRGIAYYNIACAYSLMKKADEAFENIDRAYQLEMDEIDSVVRDPDLTFMRSDPRFKKFLAELAAPFQEKPLPRQKTVAALKVERADRPDPQASFSPAVRRNSKSIVMVDAPNVSMGVSSGFIISEDGYILTSHDVAALKVPALHVFTADSQIHKARVVYLAPELDLALIKVDAKTPFTPVQFGNSDHVGLGDWLIQFSIAIGFQSADGSPAFSTGMVFDKPGPGPDGKPDPAGMIQFDAPPTPGSTAGPVTDEEGRVVGVWMQRDTKKGQKRTAHLLSSALPGNRVKALLKKIETEQKMKPGTLIQPGPAEPKRIPKDRPDFAKLIRTQRPSVVTVSTTEADAPAVSGTVISADGLILTSFQVASKAPEKLVVITSAAKRYTAKLVGADPQWDLALIKIQEKVQLKPVTLGRSKEATIGSWVMLLGNTLGFAEAEGRASATVGIVSALNRVTGRFLGRGTPPLRYTNAIQFDAASTLFQTKGASPMRLGSVGAPLFNEKGLAIGICVRVSMNPDEQKMVYGIGYGLSYALPIEAVMAEIPMLKNGQIVRHGFLGVQMRPDTPAEEKLAEQRGAVITRVVANSPAAAAGLKAGDIVIAAQEQAVISPTRVQNIIGSCLGNQMITITIVRKGKKPGEREILTLTPTLRPVGQ